MLESRHPGCHRWITPRSLWATLRSENSRGLGHGAGAGVGTLLRVLLPAARSGSHSDYRRKIPSRLQQGAGRGEGLEYTRAFCPPRAQPAGVSSDPAGEGTSQIQTPLAALLHPSGERKPREAPPQVTCCITSSYREKYYRAQQKGKNHNLQRQRTHWNWTWLGC